MAVNQNHCKRNAPKDWVYGIWLRTIILGMPVLGMFIASTWSVFTPSSSAIATEDPVTTNELNLNNTYLPNNVRVTPAHISFGYLSTLILLVSTLIKTAYPGLAEVKILLSNRIQLSGEACA